MFFYFLFCVFRLHLIPFFDFPLLTPINSGYFFVLFLGDWAKLPVFAFPTGRSVPSAAFCLANEISPHHLPILFMLEVFGVVLFLVFFQRTVIHPVCRRAG